MAWIIANTKDIAFVSWIPTIDGAGRPGANVTFRSYSGSKGMVAHALVVQDIPVDLASALAFLLAIGASQPMKFAVAGEPQWQSGGLDIAKYANDMRIGLLQEDTPL
jgi:hypothetical protein